MNTLTAERESLNARLTAIQIDQGVLTAATKRGLRPTALTDITARARSAFKRVNGAETPAAIVRTEEAPPRLGALARRAVLNRWRGGTPAVHGGPSGLLRSRPFSYPRRMEAGDWAELGDDALLEKRISQLGLKLEGTELQPLIQQLYDELSQKGLVFHPPCHVGDEWFVPVGIPAIFIPFFLVHDRLRKLERKIILEVEGDTPEWFMKLMRHEAGHAYSYAYRLYKRKKWQETFGLASTEETEFYRPRPYSRSYVVHLDDWYAQSHPDEDFAETFAVWLTPDLDWRARYRGWNALAKLEYVDALMRSLAGKPPVHQPVYRVADHDCLNVKLKTYYARKRKLYEDSHLDFYDNDLRQLFAAGPEVTDRVKASAYLRQHRRHLMNSVCQWTNERKYRVNKLLARLIDRCDQLELHLAPDHPHQHLQVASYLTTLVMNYLFTGKFKRTK